MSSAIRFGTPTSAELIADITALCLNRLMLDDAFAKQVIGTYHLSPNGDTNWYEYARFIIKEAQQRGVTLTTRLENIHPISTSEYPVPAKRPANSRLDTNKLVSTFGLHLPEWQFQAKRLVTELIL